MVVQEALVIEETVRVGNTSGVAFPGGTEVGDRGRVESRVREGNEKEVVEESREESRRAELVSQVEGERLVQHWPWRRSEPPP